jgi:hypothetical protein
MEREIQLNETVALFEELSYPVARSTVTEEFAAVTVRLADGEVNLGDLLSESSSETFDSADDLEIALHNALPREAVGEPYQSEGEG